MQKAKTPALARAGKLDIRVDEDQSTKLRETIKILVDAGYYRAKIKGLSPFDKIIGGMTWCIEVCNYDVDIDLLFHDSLSIGQKISLTEQIVKVLPLMKCPHRIEPHQIQGLDAIHIYPVIKWLVTQAAETRAEYQDEIRIIALSQFNRQYGDLIEDLTDVDNSPGTRLIRKLKARYGPTRQFVTTSPSDIDSPSERVLLTLLQYANNDDKVTILSPELTVEDEAKNLPEGLIERLRIEEQSSKKLSSKSVGLALSAQVEELATVTRQSNKKENRASNLIEMITKAEKQKVELEIDIEKKNETLSQKKLRKKELEASCLDTKKKLESLQIEAKELDAVSDSLTKAEMDQLSSLIEANEVAKKGISDFKLLCRQEADSIHAQIDVIRSKTKEKEKEVVDSALIELRDSESERLSKFRFELAKKTREIELLKRRVDDIPGRAELAQYQRRFIELINLVGSEHHQTLQFYSMYNTLSDSRSYMEKELLILNSILDNMEIGLSSPSSLVEYIGQLNSIIDGVKQSKVKLVQKQKETQSERTHLLQELSRLQDLQLIYAKQINLFSQEIARNEILLREVEKQGL